MSDDSEKKQGFKVVDRRRFDSTGNDRDDGDAEMTGDATPNMGSGQKEEIGFSSFIMSFATQALMQLGQVPPPEGMSLPIDRDAAQQTIDIISMLEKKTKGNLDAEEERFLSEVLHNLRLCYVKTA